MEKEMNSEQKYTSLADSKRLAEIGFKAEADGYWCWSEKLQQGIFTLEKRVPSELTSSGCDLFTYYKAYRLDTLLLEMPEWCFGTDQADIYGYIDKYITLDDNEMVNFVRKSYLKQLLSDCYYQPYIRLTSAVNLICLLHNEQVKEGVE